MAITINGDGSITGLSVGGLPDGIVDADTLATDSVTAAKLKSDAIADGDLPAGSILQVVSANTNTEQNQGSTNYADTGLTCALTPSSTSSKILVLVAQVGYLSVDGTSERTAFVRLYRDIGASGAEMVHREYVAQGPTANYDYPLDISLQYLDSPNTTSEVSYRTQTKLSGTSADVATQKGASYSNMTLLEIAG